MLTFNFLAAESEPKNTKPRVIFFFVCVVITVRTFGHSFCHLFHQATAEMAVETASFHKTTFLGFLQLSRESTTKKIEENKAYILIALNISLKRKFTLCKFFMEQMVQITFPAQNIFIPHLIFL